jgi:hypothetical protein
LASGQSSSKSASEFARRSEAGELQEGLKNNGQYR